MKLFDYVCPTTFWEDFSIAERFGAKAVAETFETAFEQWKDNHVFMTELVMVMNHKLWQWFNRNEAFAALYEELWARSDRYCTQHFTGEALSYFYRTTD